MRFRGMAVSPLVMGAALAISMCGTAAYGAETFAFGGVAGNTPNIAVGERQFFVDVIPTGASETTFRFTNIGPTPSSIVGITFDDQGFAGGQSASFLNDTVPTVPPSVVPPIPSPAAVLLGALGVSLIGMLRRRRMLSGEYTLNPECLRGPGSAAGPRPRGRQTLQQIRAKAQGRSAARRILVPARKTAGSMHADLSLSVDSKAGNGPRWRQPKMTPPG